MPSRFAVLVRKDGTRMSASQTGIATVRRDRSFTRMIRSPAYVGTRFEYQSPRTPVGGSGSSTGTISKYLRSFRVQRIVTKARTYTSRSAAIAVGPPVAPRSPHRSRREVFPDRAFHKGSLLHTMASFKLSLIHVLQPCTSRMTVDNSMVEALPAVPRRAL